MRISKIEFSLALDSLFKFDDFKEGVIRVETPFTYPDGDQIDVFIKEKDDLFVVTDFGSTLQWLQTCTDVDILDLHGQAIDRILQNYDICRSGFELFLDASTFKHEDLVPETIKYVKTDMIVISVMALIRVMLLVSNLYFSSSTS